MGKREEMRKEGRGTRMGTRGLGGEDEEGRGMRMGTRGWEGEVVLYIAPVTASGLHIRILPCKKAVFDSPRG